MASLIFFLRNSSTGTYDIPFLIIIIIIISQRKLLLHVGEWKRTIRTGDMDQLPSPFLFQILSCCILNNLNIEATYDEQKHRKRAGEREREKDRKKDGERVRTREKERKRETLTVTSTLLAHIFTLCNWQRPRIYFNGAIRCFYEIFCKLSQDL